MRNLSRRTFAALGVSGVLGLAGCSGSSEIEDIMENLPPSILPPNAPSAQSSGFLMPAEDTPHLRTIMQWPTNVSVYGSRDLALVQNEIVEIANAISEFEPVIMLARDNIAASIKSRFSANVGFLNIHCDDLWARDSGPTFVKSVSGGLAIAHIKFNGWGQKQTFANDGLVVSKIASHLNIPLIDSGVFGEQGGLEFDGHGTIIAHESSWISGRNNMDLGRIGGALMSALGAYKVIWAPGLKGEDITDYHIDSLARFVDKGHIAFQLPIQDGNDDPFFAAASETLERLQNSVDADGKRFKITMIESPENIRSKDPEFVSSYVNYYVCNGAVIMPEFGDAMADKAAQETMKELYPNRELVAINADYLGKFGGGIHCATQQQPAV